MIRFLLLFACLISLSTGLKAQSAADSEASTEAVQPRIERARALIAAHQLETAASELESVRAATQDYAVRNITSVMLMSIYLEAGNYGRAEALLEENFRGRAIRNGDSARTYFALAGQAVNGARTHLARYRSFGISTTDSNLPAEAANDLDRLRSFLERMIAQAKEILNEGKAYDSLSLLEDVLGIRLSLARDMEDQSKWQNDYAGARELLASQTRIASLNGISALTAGKSSLSKVSSSTYSRRRSPDVSASEKGEALHDAPPSASDPGNSLKEVSSKIEDPATSPSDTAKLNNAGSLNAKATRRVLPNYPTLAKRSGAAGLVRVHVIIDESGKVIEVSHSEGPLLLRQVAEDAARQWSFEVLATQGGPARLSGYIDFNFTL